MKSIQLGSLCSMVVLLICAVVNAQSQSQAAETAPPSTIETGKFRFYEPKQPGHTLHRELELYVKAGMTPLEAIQAATITPARVMKLENEVGIIEAGKRADLIVLDANPLERIANIRSIRYVVAQGRLFESATLWESVGFHR